MITIFHGDNVVLSRKAYFIEREKDISRAIFDGNVLNVTDFTQATKSQELFEVSPKTICIEEFFSKRKSSKETDALIDVIGKTENDNQILIWESKELTPAQAKKFPKATVLKFDFPNVLFTFLDSIKPNNAKQTITLFHQCLQTEGPELLFFMMIRQVRILLALCNHTSPSIENDKIYGIDEVKRMQQWQKTKLQKQAQLFGKEKLLLLFDQLYTIEVGQKTGKLAMNLVEAIDFLLVNL